MINLSKKFWGEAQPHFILELKNRLIDLGFENDISTCAEKSTVDFVLVKGELRFILSVGANPKKNGKVNFCPQFGIESEKVSEIKRGLQLWECDPYFRDFPEQVRETKARLCNINFITYLKSINFSEPAHTFTLENDNTEEVSSIIVNGVDFFIQSEWQSMSISNMADRLAGLCRSEQRMDEIGLSSAASAQYASLLYTLEKDYKSALEILDFGLEKELISVSSNWLDSEERKEELRAIVKCQYDKYTQYVHLQMQS
ncbi:hypothetical protein [Pseudoalteromonas luteoviolacea]|uniref:hypothetical protein n=1 Tax=Pseudoalteromonas luteoviolacea TaxID=43657 RepID=UPI00115226A0|nr:hypothetical protein [Pseudoalteromonas luteoviolacea]TQF71262.1 hypothetical protein FLM44_09270 [Pseudoalteromonas luteoviolacea]